MLSVIVVQPAPTFVASGQGGGVPPPRRGQSFDVRCTKGIVLVILYQYFRFCLPPPECVYSGSYPLCGVNPSGQVKHAVVGWGVEQSYYYCLFVVIHIHILYVVWYCQVRHEGQQSLLVAMQSRHWLSACVVGSLQVHAHPCRSVPSLCNTCQSYVINTILSLPTEVRVLVVPPIYFHALSVNT